MAYTPTVWANGDVITAEKLNKAENGIAAASVAELPSVAAADKGKVLTVDSSGDWIAAASDAAFYVTFTEDGETATADKTMAEIESAISAGKAVFCKLTGSKYIGVLTGHVHDASPENTYVNFMGYDTNADFSVNYLVVTSFYGDGYYSRSLYALTPAV